MTVQDRKRICKQRVDAMAHQLATAVLGNDWDAIARAREALAHAQQNYRSMLGVSFVHKRGVAKR